MYILNIIICIIVSIIIIIYIICNNIELLYTCRKILKHYYKYVRK